MKPPPKPVFSVLEPLQLMSEPGDDLIDRAREMVILEAMYKAHGNQSYACKLLGVSKRVFNFWAGRYELRPLDGVDWESTYPEQRKVVSKGGVGRPKRTHLRAVPCD